MMADYVIAADGSGEAEFMEYKNVQRQVRAHVARVWQELAATEAAYADFSAMLTEGGELAVVADYHADQAAALAGAEAMLLAKIGELRALIEAMNQAAPGTLFHGVPKAE